MITSVHLKQSDTIPDYILISNFCSMYKPDLFVEYGASEDITIMKIALECKHVWSVNNDDSYDPRVIASVIPNMEGFKMLTHEFNKILQERNPVIDMALINADTSWESSFKKFEELWPYVRSNGLIFIRNTYPGTDNLLMSLHGNCYITPRKIKEKYSKDCEIITLPINHGLTIVRKIY